MLPRLSMVHDHGHWIYFFVEINREVYYAVTEEDTGGWWVEFIKSSKSDQKGV